ncbi:methyltransferase domain-containing protein [Candidatus Giovannonibacteria bacterium]|nr:methyltransferase domain-containing protein [Candidatus Giovannonibacteria bacterium]
MEEFVDPKKAELKDITETHWYIPRKIDIERLCKIAELSQKNSDGNNKQIKILDLGGGKGFLSKLMADSISEKNREGMVVDLDLDQETLQNAAKFYKKTQNLHFVASNSEYEAVNVFNKKFDLIINSWSYPKEEYGGPDYSSTIKKLKPAYFVNISEERQDDTAAFDAGEDYIKIGEWSGLDTMEVVTGNLAHIDSYYSDKRRKLLKQNGSNLFEIYVRKDIGGDEQDKLRKELGSVQVKKKYKWERTLEKLYPNISPVNFDKESFLQEGQPEEDIIKKIGRRVETSRIGNTLIDVEALNKFAENLPIETVSVDSLKDYVSEGNTYWAAEDSSKLGPYQILQDWEAAQKNPLWAKHIESIKNANLDNPIWISPDGIVFDGMHRLTRAFIDGAKEIKVRRFKEIPKEAIIEEAK